MLQKLQQKKLQVVEVTGCNEERLTEIVMGLRRPSTSTTPGIEVIQDETPGLYRIERQNKDKKEYLGRVRVIGSQLWTRTYSWPIEMSLRNRNLEYYLKDTGVEFRKEFDRKAAQYLSIKEGYNVHFRPS